MFGCPLPQLRIQRQKQGKEYIGVEDERPAGEPDAKASFHNVVHAGKAVRWCRVEIGAFERKANKG